jgi:hypothetical protein
MVTAAAAKRGVVGGKKNPRNALTLLPFFSPWWKIIPVDRLYSRVLFCRPPMSTWTKSPLGLFPQATPAAITVAAAAASASSEDAAKPLALASSPAVITVGLVDIGPNLRDRVFVQDLADVLRRSFSAGVRDLVLTSTEHRSLAQNLDIIARFAATAGSSTPRMRMTCGIHPNEATTFREDTIARMRAFCLAHPQHVAAIGEVRRGNMR